jgi:hypothetical protein
MIRSSLPKIKQKYRTFPELLYTFIDSVGPVLHEPIENSFKSQGMTFIYEKFLKKKLRYYIHVISTTHEI